MSDIFTIKTKQIEFELDGVPHKVCDPPFLQKNVVLKKYRTLQKNEANLDSFDLDEQIYLVNCEIIRLYVPTISEEELKKMGFSHVMTLQLELNRLAREHFGAVVEQVEKKTPVEMAVKSETP